jgi:hypothetical protein
VQRVGDDYRRHRRHTAEQLRGAPATHRQRVQRHRGRQHGDAPGRTVDVKQNRHKRTRDRECPARRAPARRQARCSGQADSHGQRPRARAAVQQRAGENHSSDEDRHGRIEEKRMTTVHGDHESSAAAGIRRTPAGV